MNASHPTTDAGGDFPLIGTVFVLGMGIPFVTAIWGYSVLSLYVSPRQIAILAATMFALVWWIILATREPDHVECVTASLVLPWIIVPVLFFVSVALQDGGAGAEQIFVDLGDLGTYGAAYMVAGVGAVALQRGVERLVDASDQHPAPQTIAVGVLAVVVLVIVTGGVYATATASSASVSDVESDFILKHSTDVRDRTTGVPGLTVTVDSPETELRLTVTAPDGTSTTERLTPDRAADGPVTVEFEAWRFEPNARSLQTGTYEVTLSALTGVTVDSTEYTIESGPQASPVQIDVVQPGTELELEYPGDAIVRDASDRTELRIGTVVTNDGDAPGTFGTRIKTVDGEFVTIRDVILESGETAVTVITLSEETLEELPTEGTDELVVELLVDRESVMTEPITLPDADTE